MILGIGVDIARISRFKSVSERVILRLFSERERDIFKVRREERMAGNFAVKEALVKALGVPFKWKEAEVMRDSLGRPYIEVSGTLKEKLLSAGVKRIHLSISHEGDYAIAFLVLEGGRNLEAFNS